ncbi:MAG: tRNA (guanosine(37)-N1)-methyltransferase TrmD [Candidatus Colwellbacteria bacterium RIFCSPLOWO2_02_FULL_44_20b]|uniref:tRNA (guanine-N(1)-)-methyltransferase n=1 Tax=Candidatus Colwellbacteria bacterium RIFCSPLOWO2_02_FULL_44_20b TaxID=1797691 RepID=A0A1G1Z5R2_9BACT|nr:MAG: tRNA (guanosine(37)-N1)-methyltransferase TrmD [Candidatus Colwellbacteria bacterium RIFCSPLOWO2_02_FULL_44_20b]
MRFDIITIFPDIIKSYTDESIIKRAVARKLLKIDIHDLRNFASGKHKKVDDKPYGGGPGMVMKAEPVIKAVKSLKPKKQETIIITFSPAGKEFNAAYARKLAAQKNLILIADRYEGMDERVKKILKSEYRLKTFSIGPYVVTGGELPSLIVLDAVARHIPNVLGKEESLEEKRYGVGVPVYTRPKIIKIKGKKYSVPKVLTSGNHEQVEMWRKKNKKPNF